MSTLGGSTAPSYQYSFSQGQAAWWYLADSSGRLQAQRPGTSGLATMYEYDLAGNTTVATNPRWHSWNGADSYAANDRVRYYDAANRLRVTEARTSWPPSNSQYYQILIERDEARYDALGRRVWYEVRRRCHANSPAEFDCRRSYAQRTVWDGDREVWEVRAPTASEFVTLPPQVQGSAERDSLLPEFPTHPLGNFHFDPNPFFGAVGYGYLGGVDQPVTVERFHYADKFWNGWPSSTQPIWRAPPFTIFPHWNAQGQADLGVVRDGGRHFCSGGRCTAALSWPALKSPIDPGASLRFGWMGSLLEDKRDADGTLYRRHRYLDPQSGRFTQPDPIGIAGGLNLYGYANGDPVNYSDPFGLCTAADGWRDCDRMINAVQGMQVLVAAIRSGEWTYSQFPSGRRGDPATPQVGQLLGDCTDFCRSAVRGALGSAWRSSRKASTAMFKAGDHPGFTEVEAPMARTGDVIVQGGHAGVFIGRDAKGNPWGWANNGSPTRADGSGYRDRSTGAVSFAAGSFGAGTARYYRPISP